MRLFFCFALFAGLLATVSPAAAAPPNGAAPPDSAAERGEAERSLPGRFSLEGYGTVNYFSYDWDTDPDRRNVIDLERFVLYPGYRFSETISVLGEIEIEHGGTGVTKEFDPFEEAGEFETEVEAGGEVLLEQLHLQFDFAPAFGLRVGRLKVPVGLAAVLDEPGEYLTTRRSEMERRMIPVNWYENGLQLFGQLAAGGRVHYAASLVNGLDASGFSSADWVRRGHQTRFEEVRAENLAGALRLDFDLEGLGGFSEDSFVGASGYVGDSADNRPKPDLDADATVVVADVHAALSRGPLRARGLFLYGHLQNADLVSQANRNLSSQLGAKSTPVGSVARGALVEAGYDVLSLFRQPSADGPFGAQHLDLFARFETYDTLAETTGEVFDTPRWQRTVYTGGLNYRLLDGDVVFKAQYARRILGTDQVENTASLGFGFEF